MFIARYERTMASARQIIPDTGMTTARTPKRDRLIAISRKWVEQHEALTHRRQMERERIEAEKAAWRQRQLRNSAGRFGGAKAVEIIDMVAAWHGVTIEDILGKARVKKLAAARHDAIAAVYRNCRKMGRPYSLTEMGKIFSRDHTSIMYALRKCGDAA